MEASDAACVYADHPLHSPCLSPSIPLDYPALSSPQTFVLNPDAGSYYVFNDLFRLNYG